MLPYAYERGPRLPHPPCRVARRSAGVEQTKPHRTHLGECKYAFTVHCIGGLCLRFDAERIPFLASQSKVHRHRTVTVLRRHRIWVIRAPLEELSQTESRESARSGLQLLQREVQLL